MREQIIVSLTSWSKRLQNLPKVLDNIYEQTLKPDKVVLNLSIEEFPNKEKDLPEEILKYMLIKNVEIYWVSGKNTKQWKKIIPTLFRYPNDCVICIDDDVIYSNNFISELWKGHTKYPNNPITINKTFKVHGCLQHCGIGTLEKLEFYDKFSGIDLDEIYSELQSSDTVYTYLLNRCNNCLLPIEGQISHKFFNTIEPLSKNVIHHSDFEKAWQFLLQKYPMDPKTKIININKNSNNPYCVFGVADTEKGRVIEKEMRAWLEPKYNLIEIWHDGSQYEYPAMKYMQDLCIKTGKPCLYVHTRGAFNVHKTTTLRTRKMWKHEYGVNRDKYFKLVNCEQPTCACPFTGTNKYTWYNGFVVNAAAMKSIPTLCPSKDRMDFERIFKGSDVNVIGTCTYDEDGEEMNSVHAAREYLKKYYK